ncbi:cytochrome b6f subunit PetP [Trichothermofontia sp.]
MMEIGQTVKVRRVRDRIPAEVVSKIKQNPKGTVQGYKMVDGSGVGVVVQFESGFSTWFFEDEVERA